MTYRQKVLKAAYPVLMWVTKLAGKNSKELSGTKQPPISFYSLKAILNNGDTLDFANLKGKKIMLVNTASDCGYTNQLNDLQKLSEQYSEKLVINPVYQWLTDSTKNGWNDQSPSWNFTKYIVNEGGVLTNYFGPSVSPLSKDVTKAISE